MPTIQRPLPPMGVDSVDHARRARSTDGDRTKADRSSDVDRWLAHLNQAIDESSWAGKHEALATFMGLDKAYLSRLRSGEKPWRVGHVVALPDEIESRFSDLRAESFGRIVVVPATGDDAVRQLVSGLLGVLLDRQAA